MKELTKDELKKVELNILIDVAKFCDDNGIRYYLAGGTLLGAVRHGGFIPWDDDIDILMPRPDYIKFLNLYNKKKSTYIVKAIEIDQSYWRTFAKVIDLRTYLCEKSIRIPKKDNGVFIDIFPVDGLPKSKLRQKIFFKEQEFLNFLYHSSAWNYTKSFKYEDSKDKFAEAKGIIRTGLKFIAITFLYFLPTSYLIKLINRNAMRFEYDASIEVAASIDCHYGGAREKMPKILFEGRKKFLFEKNFFWGSTAWNLYLTNLYGNYMELPPKNKRKSHHDFKAYWKEGYSGENL